MKVQNAEKWAQKQFNPKLKAETVKRYEQMFTRLNDSGKTPGTSDNPRTRHFERSAAKYIYAKQILASTGDYVIISSICKKVNAIDDIASDNLAMYRAGDWVGKIVHRNSKKSSIQKLPTDWREALLSAMAKSKFYDGVRVLGLVGCRLSELKNGVVVSVDGESVSITIAGSKIDQKRGIGQVERTIIFKASDPLVSGLKSGVVKVDGRISESIARHAEDLGFTGVTGYSFRHQVASDLKSSGYSQRSIACALGHQAMKSQEGYGNSGAGRSLDVEVSATSEPRKAPAPKKKDEPAAITFTLQRNFSAKVITPPPAPSRPKPR